MEREEKSLDRWSFEIRTIGKKHWGRFYENFLGSAPSNMPRFYKAVNNYGMVRMMEAIVEASNRNLTGDPLNYVLKVASEKWKESERENEKDSDYADTINRAKEISLRKNEALAKRIRKGRKGS
jgi:hypothetical protein